MISGMEQDRSSLSTTPNSTSANDSSKENSSASRVIKKRLPPTDMATQAKLAQRMIDPKTATPKGGHSYGPYFLEYCLMAEYDLLHKQKSLSGVYVIPSSLTPLMWHGVMFIRQGLYQGGVYRFQLFIPDTYPDADCPSVIFDPPVFHPIINPSNGELDVQRAFPKWKRHVNHVWQVLMYAKRSFYKIDTKNPLNDEASKLYDTDLEFFKYKLSECNKRCLDRLYDLPKSEDPHLFRFEPWDHFKHEEARKKMIQDQKPSDYHARAVGISVRFPLLLQEKVSEAESSPAKGLSWMASDKLGPFQKYNQKTTADTT